MKTTTLLLLTLLISLSGTRAEDFKWDADEVYFQTGIDISDKPDLKFWKLKDYERGQYIDENCLYKKDRPFRKKFTCESKEEVCDPWFDPCDGQEAEHKIFFSGYACHSFSTATLRKVTSFTMGGKDLPIHNKYPFLNGGIGSYFYGDNFDFSPYRRLTPDETRPLAPEADVGIYWGNLPYSLDDSDRALHTLGVRLTTGTRTVVSDDYNKITDLWAMIVTRDGVTPFAGGIINTVTYTMDCTFEDLPAPTIE